MEASFKSQSKMENSVLKINYSYLHIRNMFENSIFKGTGVEWVHGLFFFPLVLGKMLLPHAKLGLFG